MCVCVCVCVCVCAKYLLWSFSTRRWRNVCSRLWRHRSGIRVSRTFLCWPFARVFPDFHWWKPERHSLPYCRMILEARKNRFTTCCLLTVDCCVRCLFVNKYWARVNTSTTVNIALAFTLCAISNNIITTWQKRFDFKYRDWAQRESYWHKNWGGIWRIGPLPCLKRWKWPQPGKWKDGQKRRFRMNLPNVSPDLDRPWILNHVEVAPADGQYWNSEWFMRIWPRYFDWKKGAARRWQLFDRNNSSHSLASHELHPPEALPAA